MNKKLFAVLSILFVIFLGLGIMLNAQQGLRFQEQDFWRLNRNGSYRCNRDRITPLGDGKFELFLNGETFTATQTSLPDGGVRMDYSDGWAVERSAEDDYLYSFGSFAWANDAKLFLTDMEAANLHFAEAAREEHHPFYDTPNGNIIGETVEILAEGGEVLDWREIWFEHPQHSTPERETIILQEGAVVPGNLGYYDTIIRDSEGRYLLDAHEAGRIRFTTYSEDRCAFTHLLLEMSQRKTEARGEAVSIFAYILLFCLGAAQLLWPEKLAFFGSRWQYREEPHLSDAGLTAACIGGCVLIFAGIIALFIAL